MVVKYVEREKPKTRSIGVGTSEKPPSNSLLRHTTASMAQHNVRRRFAIEAEQQLAKRSGLSTLRTAVTAVEAFRRAGQAGAASSSRSSSALPTPASSAPPSPEHKREPGPGGYTGGPPGGVGSGVASPESSCGGYPGGGSNPSERDLGFFIKDREGAVSFRQGYSPATAAERLKQAASVLTTTSPGAGLKSYEKPR